MPLTVDGAEHGLDLPPGGPERSTSPSELLAANDDAGRKKSTDAGSSSHTRGRMPTITLSAADAQLPQLRADAGRAGPSSRFCWGEPSRLRGRKPSGEPLLATPSDDAGLMLSGSSWSNWNRPARLTAMWPSREPSLAAPTEDAGLMLPGSSWSSWSGPSVWPSRELLLAAPADDAGLRLSGSSDAQGRARASTGSERSEPPTLTVTTDCEAPLQVSPLLPRRETMVPLTVDGAEQGLEHPLCGTVSRTRGAETGREPADSTLDCESATSSARLFASSVSRRNCGADDGLDGWPSDPSSLSN